MIETTNEVKHSLEDKQLIADLKNETTKNKAFETLVVRYQQRLYWHIRKMVLDHEDANDLLQNVFLKVWRNIENFREDAQLFTWLYRIATNECITFLQQKKKRNNISIDADDTILEPIITEGPLFTGDQIQKKLQLALLTLPTKQRTVFNMKYFDEMKYEEIAAVLQVTVGALKASYHHAVKKIEHYFNTH
ncbi:MAG: Sigma-24 [Bacteroidota bacterium]|jgi:RNA polymerase sigma factor (sigma-70 family)